MRRIVLAVLAFVALLSYAISVRADTRVQFAGNVGYILTNVPFKTWDLSTITYIINVPSQAAVNLYFTNNNAGAQPITVTTFSTADARIPDYSNNTQYWIPQNFVVVGVTNAFTNTNVLSVPATGTVVMSSGTINASQIAIQLSTTNNSANTLNLTAVIAPNGQLGLVQGQVANGGQAAGVNPVLTCGYKSNSTLCTPQEFDTVGGVLFGGNNTADGATSLMTNLPVPVGDPAVVLMTTPVVYDSPLGGFVKMYNPSVAASLAATASGNTAIVTGTIMQRLQCVGLEVTSNATLGAGAELVISLQDNATAVPGFVWRVFVPAAAAANTPLYVLPETCYGAGVLLASSADTWNLNLSAALTAGHVNIRVHGSAR